MAWAACCAGLGGALKRGASCVLAMGLLASTSPSRVATHAQCDDFPTSSPMMVPGLLGGAMVVSSNRQADREPSLRHPHCLVVAPAPGSFLSVVRSGERLRWQHPPRGLFGVGADGHPEAPDRRPLGACPYRRQCAECSPPKPIGGLPQTVMGRRFGAGLTGTYGSTCNKARAFGCGSAVLWKRMHASYLGHLRTMS